jgi:CBS domain-containing protein
MTVIDICNRNVVVAPKTEMIVDAAKRMRTSHVGALVVIDNRNGRHVPIGIVTDRDIVVRAIAEGRDPRMGRVPEAMTADVVSVPDTADVKEAARLMRDRQIRRIVVVDSNQRVVGIVSLGDIAVEIRDDKMSGDVLEKVSKDAVTVANR